jgi:hypothetical protein
MVGSSSYDTVFTWPSNATLASSLRENVNLLQPVGGAFLL